MDHSFDSFPLSTVYACWQTCGNMLWMLIVLWVICIMYIVYGITVSNYQYVYVLSSMSMMFKVWLICMMYLFWSSWCITESLINIYYSLWSINILSISVIFNLVLYIYIYDVSPVSWFWGSSCPYQILVFPCPPCLMSSCQVT